MKLHVLIAIVFFTLLCPVSSAVAGKAKLKGLLVTGGCCHDYTNQKRIITEGISQRASIDWDIVHEGGTGRNHKVSVYLKKDGQSNTTSSSTMSVLVASKMQSSSSQSWPLITRACRRSSFIVHFTATVEPVRVPTRGVN